VLALRTRFQLTVPERAALLGYLIHVFQSLENETVRGAALPLVSLPLWHALSPGRLQLELASLPQVEKHWRSLLRRESKAAKQDGQAPLAQQPQVAFLPSLLDDFLVLLGEAVGSAGEADPPRVAYCEARARTSRLTPQSDASVALHGAAHRPAVAAAHAPLRAHASGRPRAGRQVQALAAR